MPEDKVGKFLDLELEDLVQNGLTPKDNCWKIALSTEGYFEYGFIENHSNLKVDRAA